MVLEKQDSAISLSADVSSSVECLDRKNSSDSKASLDSKVSSDSKVSLDSKGSYDCVFTEDSDDLPVFTHRHVECSLCR